MKAKQVFYLILLMSVAAMILQDAEVFYMVAGALFIGVIFGGTIVFNKWELTSKDWQLKYLQEKRDADTYFTQAMSRADELKAWKLATSNVRLNPDDYPINVTEQQEFREKYAQLLSDSMEKSRLQSELADTVKYCEELASRLNRAEMQLTMSGNDAWKSQLIDEAITLVMKETKYDTYDSAREYLFNEYVYKGEPKPSRYFNFYNTVVTRSIENAAGGRARQSQN